MTITEHDLRTMVGIAASPDDGDSGDLLPESLLTGLQMLIECDAITFQAYDAQRRDVLIGQSVGHSPPIADEIREGLAAAFSAHYWDSASCCYPDVSGDLETVTTASDFYSDRERHSTAMYCEYLRYFGWERELMLCLPSVPGRTVRFLFWRGAGSDFSQRQRDLLTLLRPHLHNAYRERQLRQAVGPRLTTRQWQLLRLVAAGQTNGQIARRLAISEATVRKHLENVFQRLQVTSRTAAVTQAFGSGTALR
jgi:DNA-binding CsgD family transcriptional regulator